jgi:uncharacterized protein
LIRQPETNAQTEVTEASKNPNWVPWNSRQVFYTTLFMLIPWIGLNLLLNSLSSGAPLTKPLTFSDDLAAAITQFIFTALVEGTFLIVPYYYANKTLTSQAIERAGSRLHAIMLNLGLRRFKLSRTLPWIIGLLVLIIGVDVLYSYIVTQFHLNIQTNDQVVSQIGQYAPLTMYAVLLGSVIIAPFCEEIFFRGFLLPGLLHELSPVWAVVISSLLFAIAHVDPGSFVPLFAIGLCLGFLRLRSGSTWASISLHILNNLLGSVLIILALYHINIPLLS